MYIGNSRDFIQDNKVNELESLHDSDLSEFVTGLALYPKLEPHEIMKSKEVQNNTSKLDLRVIIEFVLQNDS